MLFGLNNMRSLLLAFAITFILTACGYRTPLSLPKPQAKPPAPTSAPNTAPTESEAK
jgi:predicted small lipoprotein YifL